MASEVQIANRALSMLGEARITSLSDNNKGARAMNARFDLLRDAELMAYAWRFAVKRTQIAASTETPEWGYGKIYPLPSDCLRPIMVNGAAVNPNAVGLYYSATGYRGEDPAWEVIGGEIQTDLSSPLDLEYVAQITDTGAFDALFAEALAARLAADAAEELTQSNSKKEAALFTYRKTLSEARRVNAIQRMPRRRASGSWFESRFVV